MARHRNIHGVTHYVYRWRGVYYYALCREYDNATTGAYTDEPGPVTCFWCATGRLRDV